MDDKIVYTLDVNDKAFQARLDNAIKKLDRLEDQAKAIDTLKLNGVSTQLSKMSSGLDQARQLAQQLGAALSQISKNGGLPSGFSKQINSLQGKLSWLGQQPKKMIAASVTPAVAATGVSQAAQTTKTLALNKLNLNLNRQIASAIRQATVNQTRLNTVVTRTSRSTDNFANTMARASQGISRINFGLSLMSRPGAAGGGISNIGSGLTNVFAALGPEAMAAGAAIGVVVAVLGTFVTIGQKVVRVVSTIVEKFKQWAGLNNMLEDSFNEFLKYESSLKRVAGIFGNSTQAVINFIGTQSDYLAMGMASAAEYAATFGNITSSIAKNSAQNSEMVIKLMRVAAIIASKTGRSYEDVANRIRSGLLGNTRAIDDLGTYTNLSMIKHSKAFEKIANGRTWNQLTYTEQQQVRLMAILDQATKKYGDTLAETASIKVARFTAAISNLKATFGQFILAALAPVIEGITVFVNALSQALMAIAAIMGVKIDITGSFGDIADGGDDAGDALGGAAKAAKDFLAPFDEITRIENSRGGGGGGGSGSGSFSSIITPLEDEVKFPWLEELAKWFKNSKINELLKTFADIGKWVYDNVIKPIGNFAGQAGIKFLELFDSACGVLNTTLKILKDPMQKFFEEVIKPLGEFIGATFIKFLEDTADQLDALAKWMEEHPEEVKAGFEILKLGFLLLLAPATTLYLILVGFVTILSALAEAVATVAGIILALSKGDWKTAIELMASPLESKNPIFKLFASIVKSIASAVKEVATFLKSIADGDWKKAFELLSKPVNSANPILKLFATIVEAIALVVRATVKAIDAISKGDWKKAFEELAKPFKGTNEALKLFKDLVTAIGSIVATVAKALLSLAKGDWKKAIEELAKPLESKNPVLKEFATILGVISSTALILTGILLTLGTNFASMMATLAPEGSKWHTFWTGIAEDTTEALNGIKKVQVNIANNVIEKINGIFDSLEGFINKIIDVVNLFTRLTGYTIPHINLPKVPTVPPPGGGGGGGGGNRPRPALASGGVVSSPTVALIGEAGREAVIPLENNLGWLEKMSSMISSKISGESSAPVYVFIGDEQIEAVVMRANDRILVKSNGRA